MTTSDSEPEPDLVVVRGDETTYLHKHPGPADVGMLIEVATYGAQRNLPERPRPRCSQLHVRRSERQCGRRSVVG